MTISGKAMGWAAVAVLVAMAGCTTSRSSIPRADIGTPLPQLTPVETASVQQGSLPPVGAGGQPVDGSVPGQFDQPDGLGQSQDPMLAGSDPSFVTLNDLNNGDSIATLNGPLRIEDLLGGWTIQDAISVCRLNLTYTAKGDTGRYRASAPGCGVTGVAAVSSWQLAGSQVQLYGEGDLLIGTLLLSGGRFVGTMAGGLGVTMER